MEMPGRIHMGAVVRRQGNGFYCPALAVGQVAGL